MKTLLAALLLALLFSSCGSKDETLKKVGMLPPARGAKGEIVLVMDSLKWKGPLGEALREVFAEVIPGMPQPEKTFSIVYVGASGLNNLLKQHRSLVVVTTFDSKSGESSFLQEGFTEESVKRIQGDSSLYMLKSEDLYATGQWVIHLFSLNEGQLMRKLKANKKYLQELLDDRETQRIGRSLLDPAALNKEMAEVLRKNQGISLKIPKGYQLAKDTADFFWLRYPEVDFDKNIFVASKPYTSEKQFAKDSIVAWRNAIGKAHLYSDREKNPQSYMLTEDRLPVFMDTCSLQGQYAQRLRGLWIIKEPLFGGPFISYIFTNKKTGRIYYAEGFLYAAGSEKREHVREMKVVLDALKVAE